MKKCKTCHGEGGITVENFNDSESFECPDCKGMGEQKEKPFQWLIDELQRAIEFQEKHGIDNSALTPLLKKAKEKQKDTLSNLRDKGERRG